ncbi:hypothetical protein EOM75_14655, partial [Candidatus Falkowbacteria bacterium]|nr:hypothetical protein [Candidatus Falkowbacteria bacterium]
MNTAEILEHYTGNAQVRQLAELLQQEQTQRVHLSGSKGSQRAFVAASVMQILRGTQVFVLPDKESAAYFHNDLESLFGERNKDYNKRKVLFFPTSYKRPYEIEKTDASNILLRSEVLN